MPEPRDGEKQGDFVGRCVKQVMGEGKTQDQALGACYGIWRQHHGGTAKSFWETMVDLFKQPTMNAVHAQTALGNERRMLDFNEAMTTMESTDERLVSDPDEDEDQDDVDDADDFYDPDDDIVHGVSPADKHWSLPLTIKKTDPDRRLVFGWASVVEKDGKAIIDKQGDIIPVQELENAAYQYVLESRDGGDMHERRGVSRLVASLVTTPDIMKAFGITLDSDQVGWIVGFRVEDDELWAAYKRGERPEFSIGGAASSAYLDDEVVDSGLWRDVGFVDKRRRGRRLARAPFRYDGSE